MRLLFQMRQQLQSHRLRRLQVAMTNCSLEDQQINVVKHADSR